MVPVPEQRESRYSMFLRCLVLISAVTAIPASIALHPCSVSIPGSWTEIRAT